MADPARIPRLVSELKDLFAELSGQDISADAPETSFFDQGFDSLLLTQAAQAASKRFGVKLKLRHLAEDFPSCALLAGYLDSTLEPTRFAQTVPVAQVMPASSQPTAAAVVAALAGGLAVAGAHGAPAGRRELVDSVVRQQLALMARQLELLGAAPAAGSSAARPVTVGAAALPPSAAVEPAAPAPAADEKPHRHGPQLVIERANKAQLTPTQEKHLAKLFSSYTAKTARSKEFTARNRVHVADPRTVAGFKPALKELVYPIVVERSSGCRLWDLDGNEYIDLLSGYGSNFFGFGPRFIREAIAKQMEIGMEIGPQTHLVEEVTELFRAFVPADRVAFCNTGSEAVLATLRMARTATGRDLVVMFAGGYHGMFDEVVVRSTKKRSMPAAPGIPTSAVDNILVLPWAEPESLEVIRKRADEIAAVIVEPVQSRFPEIQPAEFLRSLRQITEQTGSALIFDEVVCGFRVAPGGGQEHYGIAADIASYGKVIGGGLSIGVVAGKREYMDTLDGGHWSYGDASVPEVGVTYFAGTFVRHPLSLACARASLRYLKEQGPDLQRRINEKTTRFATRLNRLFQEQQVPLELRHFSSIMKFAHLREVPLGELVFNHVRERGVHVWDGRPSFLTEAHTEADLDFVVEAFAGAIADMQAGDFYPPPVVQERADQPPVVGARLGKDPRGRPTWYVPDPQAAGRYVPYTRGER